MSHHLDSPESRRDPRLNITDQYVFGAGAATVFVVNVNTSLADEIPGFHPEGRYEIHVHLDDDAYEGVTYRFTFENVDPEGRQGYVVERLAGAAVGDPEVNGQVLASGRTGDATAPATASGFRAWAGTAVDPFYLDLRQLRAVINAVAGDAVVPLAPPDDAESTFSGSHVNSLVLRVPYDEVLVPQRRVRVWAATYLATDAGGWRQVNRAGLPMIWPIFRPDDSEEASIANEGHPSRDVSVYTADIAARVARLAGSRGTVSDPESYGRAVAGRFLPDLLPYTVGTPGSFDVNAFNGRCLRDNAPEVMFTLALGAALPTGLTPPEAESLHSADFPYVLPVPVPAPVGS